MDAGILNKLKAVAELGDQKKDVEQAALKAQTSGEMGAWFSSPHGRGDLEELAYDITQVAWRDAMAQDITPQIIEVKNVGIGDIDYIDQFVAGLSAVWQGVGGQIESGVLRGDRYPMPRQAMAAAVILHIDEIATNFWGQMSQLQAQATDKIRQLPPKRLVQLIQAAITTGNALYLEAAAASLTAAQVDSIIRPVSQKAGGQIKLMGTPTAVQLFSSNLALQFGDPAKESLFTTGVIGQYKGVGIVQVDNWLDEFDNWQLPDNEIWVVGRNAGRLTYYGQPNSQILQRPAFETRWETERKAGMLLYGASRGRIGRIKLT